MRTFASVVVLACVASVAPVGAAGAAAQEQASGGPFVSVLLGRSMWTQSEDCQAVAGQPTLLDVAALLAARGVAATGVVVPARTDEATVTCTNGNLYPSWLELGRLRDEFGWSFVSNGQERRNITALPPAAQVRESCGSLEAFERHGHQRAWGLYGPGTNRITPQIATDVVGTCFGFVRAYAGTSRNTQTAAAAPPYYVRTDDTNGGTCNRAPCTGEATFRKPYRLPSAMLADALAAGPQEWVVLSTYKLLVGANLATGDRRWDCTSPDPLDHWTSEEEAYCLDDLLAVVDQLPAGRVVTDPAGMAERWGRVPSPVRRPLWSADPRVAPLPQPLRTYGELTAAEVPARIADTRAGLGVGRGGALVAGAPLDLQVAGVGGVPATGLAQVVLNVTLAGPTRDAYLTVRPSGAGRPESSVLNVRAGDTVANQAVVAVGPDGGVELDLSAGAAHAVVDVLAWTTDETAPAPGSRLTPQLAQRVLDTRGDGGRLGPGEVRLVQVVPPGQGVTAVAFNLTAVGPSEPTYLTAYPADHDRPGTANLNVAAGVTRANQVVVRVPPSGLVALFNEAGSTHVLVDVVGTFRPSQGGDDRAGRLVPLTSSVRLVDTRTEGRPVRAGSPATWDLSLLGAAAGVPVRGALVNVTVLAATSPTYVTVHPGATAAPMSSTLNVRPGEAVPNAVVAELGPEGGLAVTVGSGSVHLLVDATAVVLG